MKKILFICPYPVGLAPSQRFRFEQYASRMKNESITPVIKPFFTEKGYYALYQNGHLLSKIHCIVHSYFKRFALLLQVHSFDFVFIHREATPVGPPVIEWIIAKILRKKIIFDFDDAIWTTDKTNEHAFSKWIRWRSKVGTICRWSYKVSCGNDYLADFARHHNENVVVIPTTIASFGPVTREATDPSGRVVIGWTGSHSTLKYLHALLPVLTSLQEKYPSAGFLVIADKDPNLSVTNMRFLKWKKASEIEDLESIDIGVMPLPDDEWARGKCGFKALQYMALSIPAVVSPVGINKKIVTHGVEGFLCSTPDEWFSALEYLILNRNERMAMGRKGRQKVMDYYSMEANLSKFLSLFQ